MSAGNGREISTNELSNLNLHGVDMESVVLRSIILSGLLCGLLGVILDLPGVKTTCGNKYCCNPFHLIPQNVGVFVDHDSYLESFELACELHTLKQQVAEYVVEQAIKEQEKLDADG